MAASTAYRLARVGTFILYILGIGLAVYAYYVEFQKEKNKGFVAACDISETISCSKVFTSKYGRGFGLVELVVGRHHWLNQPNSLLGLAFYAVQIILSLSGNIYASMLQVFLSVTANFGSVYLAYILYFILEDVCVVCMSMYAVNFFLLLCHISKWRHLRGLTERKAAARRSKKRQ